MSVVYKATNVYGETAHFGAHSAAMGLRGHSRVL